MRYPRTSSLLALTLLHLLSLQFATSAEIQSYELAASGLIGAGPQPFKTNVDVYNGSLNFQQYPGGSSTTIYYDEEIPITTYTGLYAQIVNLTACGFSNPHYHPGIVEMNYVLEGDDLIAGLLLQTDATGTQSTWLTGLSKGGVATVTASSIHYAENQGCGNASLLQVFAGLPNNYDFLPYIDLPAALLSQDATAMQFAYGMTSEQLDTAIYTVKPLFSVNTTCLAACNAAAKAGTAG